MKFWFGLLILASLLACSSGGNDDTAVTGSGTEAFTYSQPLSGNGWDSAHLNDVGMNTDLIEAMINDEELANIHGIVLVRNNRLVFETYRAGRNADGQQRNYDKDLDHDIQSCTKSITSLLVGVAIQEGHIGGADDMLVDYLPQYSSLFRDGKENISLSHAMTMTAGIDWDEWRYPYNDSRNPHTRMNQSNDAVAFVLGRDMIADPGLVFSYNSGLTITMGAVVTGATGQPALNFAQQHLLAPMGISDYFWYAYPNGHLHTGGGLYLIPRDMAKFGQLILDDGVWKGQQLVDPEWLAQSTGPHVILPDAWLDNSYGYFWWRKNLPEFNDVAIHASGWGGQYIIALPAHDLVVIFTGGNYTNQALTEVPFRLLTQYILPAIQ